MWTGASYFGESVMGGGGMSAPLYKKAVRPQGIYSLVIDLSSLIERHYFNKLGVFSAVERNLSRGIGLFSALEKKHVYYEGLLSIICKQYEQDVVLSSNVGYEVYTELPLYAKEISKDLNSLSYTKLLKLLANLKYFNHTR